MVTRLKNLTYRIPGCRTDNSTITQSAQHLDAWYGIIGHMPLDRLPPSSSSRTPRFA
ncbi:hypothetical protein AG1IA_04798 [Rhizoctonia solani AG-1 IA]|uniref:Uncharacterized protein n=1 Tax=Thanatephorus cucumeris (strain AG1-IA) TaxID=983506 RepID=L8WWK9_THACA|nr:hypothetical protein AG1IA_04798 [Rhizoctonia solani AG-1 IA]